MISREQNSRGMGKIATFEIPNLIVDAILHKTPPIENNSSPHPVTTFIFRRDSLPPTLYLKPQSEIISLEQSIRNWTIHPSIPSLNPRR